MQVKRFIAPNMRLALKQVRDEQGPEAVILSNKRVPQGVEVMIAVEDPVRAPRAVEPQQPQPPVTQALIDTEPSKLEREVERMRRESRQRAETLATTLASKQQKNFAQAMAQIHEADSAAPIDSPVKQPSQSIDDRKNHTTPKQSVQSTSSDESTLVAAHEKQMAQMRAELQSMRNLLEHQLSTMAWGQYSTSNPERASLWRRLTKMGIQAHVADGLLDGIKNISSEKDAWSKLTQSLTLELPVVGEDLIDQGGVFAFVGPTGAGKTTTIGKLAARYVMDQGAANIALVTTDTVRVAGHEQLRTIGRILNVPVKVVDKQNTLDRVLYALRHKSLVLIDTAGFSRQDQRLAQQLLSINELGAKAKTLLVLPCSSQPAVLTAAFHSYKTDNMDACVLTKLDEAHCLGGALSVAMDKQLPVAYTSNGQGIPDDLHVAQSVALVKESIELTKHQMIDDRVMSEELASLNVVSR